jgi:hypothetical protein
MTHIDQIIADALAGSPETHVAILAREVVRLRGWPAVVVPPLPKPTGRRADDAPVWGMPQDLEDVCRQSGNPVLAAYQVGIRRGHAIAENSVRPIPADRVLGEGMVALRRFAERCAQRDHQPDEHIGSAKCVACEAEDALRANHGGADHD